MGEFIRTFGALIAALGSVMGMGIVYGTMKTKIEAAKSDILELERKKANKETVEQQFCAVNEKLDILIDLIKNGKRKR
jgi:hypothetical protein